MYLDDVIVLINSEDDHMKHLYEILTVITSPRVSMNLRKFSFITKSTNVFALIV